MQNQVNKERTDFIDTARVYLRAGKGGDGAHFPQRSSCLTAA